MDKVPHKRLISKLQSYGLHGNIISWITEFLTARKYRVKVNTTFYNWDDVTSGIPQGSVLGPLLFLIYINDLTDSCGTYSDVYVFADDAKFFLHTLTLDNSKSLQNALESLQNWSKQWLLNLKLKNAK